MTPPHPPPAPPRGGPSLADLSRPPPAGWSTGLMGSERDPDAQRHMAGCISRTCGLLYTGSPRCRPLSHKGAERDGSVSAQTSPGQQQPGWSATKACFLPAHSGTLHICPPSSPTLLAPSADNWREWEVPKEAWGRRQAPLGTASVPIFTSTQGGLGLITGPI